MAMSTLAACAASSGAGPGSLGVAPLAPAAASAPATEPPAPVPPPAAAEAAPASFTVYFDTDSAEIRASAMQILYGAAQMARQHRPTAIRIHGYTDARGRKSHNQKLSEARAAAVADQFRKLGVTVAVIEVKGYGESRPAIAAKGDARENRRVEIVFEGAVPAAAAPAPSSALMQAQSAIAHDRPDITVTASPLLPAPAPLQVVACGPLHPPLKTAIKPVRVPTARTGSPQPPPTRPGASLAGMGGRAV